MELNLLKSLTDRLKPGLLWSSAVYLEPADFDPRRPFRSTPATFDPRAGKRGHDFVHTLADPFLFVRGDSLYLFLEAQPSGSRGHIEAYVSADARRWEALGPVLAEPHHLSYPYVFEEAGHVFMIPESGSAGEVALYRLDKFPGQLRKERCLLRGDYVDSSPIFHDGLWYLFTTGPRGLELFVAEDLLAGDLRAHPASPITNDPRLRRCGGVPVRIGGDLFRIAQNCADRYGGNLNLMRIEELTPERYAERLDTADLFSCDQPWNALGGHHLSTVAFRGGTAVAIDGQSRDTYRSKAESLRRKLLGRR